MANETSPVAPEHAPNTLRPKGRRRSDLPFEQYIKKKLDYIDRLNEEQERRRIQTYVTLTRRYRGDLFSFFAGDNSGTWIDVRGAGLKRVNIVAPVVRANNKNWMEADVRIEVIAKNSDDPEKQGGADIAQSLVNMLVEQVWNDHFQEMTSELAQLSGEYFLESKYNKDKGPKIRVPQLARQDVTLEGKYFCAQCGASGPRSEAELTGGCPQPGCGAAVTLSDPLVMNGVEAPADYDDMTGGDVETRVFTAYEMKVDERNSKGGDLSKCRWIRNNYLVYRNELEEMRPWAKLDGKTEWTEGLKQQRALETSAQTNDRMSEDQGTNDTDEDLLDFRRYWLDRKMVAGYVAPADYAHGDQEYGYTFSIKAGQTFDDVYADKEEGFAGLYVERHGDEILIFDNEDGHEVWDVGHWQMDATAFWGKALEDLLDLQEMRIELVNIFFQAGMSSSLPPLILDGRMFDGQDFINEPGAIVYTRKGFNPDNKGIADFIHQMFPQLPGNELFGLYETLVRETDNNSGISPVSIGQGDPANKTFGGQQLLTQRAIGLIVPSQKNKALCMANWARHQLKMLQKHWTPGRYIPIKTKYGEEWKQADVESFRNANIDDDFIVRHVDGTEMPESRDERLVKIGGVLGSGLLENPAIPTQLKQQVFRLANIDYDIDNFDAEIRLCSARWRRMQQAIEIFEQEGLAWLMGEDELPAADPMGKPLINPLAVQMVLHALNCEVIPESDNHAVHMEFYADQLKAEAAKDMGDPFKIAVLRARIQEQAMASAGAQAMGNALQIAGQAPAIEAQRQIADEDAQKQSARDEQSKDNEAARQAAVSEAQGPQGPPSVTAPPLH